MMTMMRISPFFRVRRHHDVRAQNSSFFGLGCCGRCHCIARGSEHSSVNQGSCHGPEEGREPINDELLGCRTGLVEVGPAEGIGRIHGRARVLGALLHEHESAGHNQRRLQKPVAGRSQNYVQHDKIDGEGQAALRQSARQEVRLQLRPRPHQRPVGRRHEAGGGQDSRGRARCHGRDARQQRQQRVVAGARGVEGHGRRRVPGRPAQFERELHEHQVHHQHQRVYYRRPIALVLRVLPDHERSRPYRRRYQRPEERHYPVQGCHLHHPVLAHLLASNSLLLCCCNFPTTAAAAIPRLRPPRQNRSRLGLKNSLVSLRIDFNFSTVASLKTLLEAPLSIDRPLSLPLSLYFRQAGAGEKAKARSRE
ncbi:hypothetical protein Mapa_006247 [Marchantia paleacea]|nr:hypothetical protein Mapa_006247 [Marchantia paleacea]